MSITNKVRNIFKKSPVYITVYDNGGKSLDRYTIVIGESVYGINEYPDRFNVYLGQVGEDVKINSSFGEIIRMSDLPVKVVKAINKRFEEEENEKI